MTGQVTDNRHRYDFHAAIMTRKQLKGCKAYELPADHSDSDDPMYEFKSKRRRVTFKPRDKIRKEMNKTLRCYENDIYKPELPLTLPMCLADFPPSSLRDEVQAPEPDSAGKLPDNDDLLYVTQLEITRLDGLNRSLIKLHENDKAMMSWMMQYIKTLEERAKAREVESEVKPRDMMQAICRNAAVREKIIGQAQGVTLAVRRRDNAMRCNFTDRQSKHEVTRRMLEIAQHEGPTLFT